jgi:hypothetical protein
MLVPILVPQRFAEPSSWESGSRSSSTKQGAKKKMLNAIVSALSTAVNLARMYQQSIKAKQEQLAQTHHQAEIDRLSRVVALLQQQYAELRLAIAQLDSAQRRGAARAFGGVPGDVQRAIDKVAELEAAFKHIR